uniref:CF1 epsilon subunit of ATP synthase n=1 Tax=Climaconeis cf. scalaris TaxID=2846828 RepID=A0A8F8SPV5_9STRA|nr:CF1 epsilon subunit of ATP synthase [Climaconeis cf. scalaris]
MVINVSVLTPDRVICSTTADEIVLPGLTGLVGVFEGHATLITALDIGLLRIKLDGKWTPIILFGGLAEIDRDYVTVLVNSVEEINDVESNNLRKEIEQANLEVERLTLEIETAETSKIRLDASEKLKRASALLQAKNYLI